MNNPTPYEKAAKWISTCETLIIHTGAGMGKDSGLPDYRGQEGQWGAIEEEKGQSVFEVMNPDYLIENPEFAWKKHSERYQAFVQTEPHRGFGILKTWTDRFSLHYFVQTSNVDGHFQKAGFEKDLVRELHGSMHYLQCSVPCSDHVWPMKVSPGELKRKIDAKEFPTCPTCGAIARPNVYMFRDKTYIDSRTKAQKQRYDNFLKTHGQTLIVVVEIGSGPHVQTVRQKTRELWSRYHAKVIRINPKDFKVKAPHIGI